MHVDPPLRFSRRFPTYLRGYMSSGLQQTWASLRSAHAAEPCYVGQTWRFLMRKKIRTISVEGKEYAWTVEGRIWPSFVLRVWRGKGDVWFEKEFAPPHFLGPVTPEDVAREIRSRLIRVAT